MSIHFYNFFQHLFDYSEYLCLFLVVNQLYTVNVMDESILRGNTAILKCHIPSFVADYVFVSGWTSDDGDEYSVNSNQAYGIEN
jgi:hypothetical protein